MDEGSEESGSPSRSESTDRDEESITFDDDPIGWLRHGEHWASVMIRDVVLALTVVALIGIVLFAVSGIWPPMVAVESGSMEPNIQTGDLIIMVDAERFTHEAATDDGIVPKDVAAEHEIERFGKPGTVLVYAPNGVSQATPIIHRAALHVEEGENWIDRADENYLGGVDTCEQVPRDACPAPADGYITRGDANPAYDPIMGQSTVVQSEWIQGKAGLRIPYLGCIRLAFESDASCW